VTWRPDFEPCTFCSKSTELSTPLTDCCELAADCPRVTADKPVDRCGISRPHRTMTEPDCKLCGDERWVSEEHPGPTNASRCRGVGVRGPRCNPAGGPDEPGAPPRGFKTAVDRKHGSRH
jgi:hypothetical protein